MYQVEAWSAVRKFWGEKRRENAATRGVGTNVLALGVTSLLTDISPEMVATVLPIFLVTLGTASGDPAHSFRTPTCPHSSQQRRQQGSQLPVKAPRAH